MKKTKFYYLELALIIVITLGLFTFASNFNLQHYIGFIIPVPLGVFIVRHDMKDGIFPALFMIAAGTLIGYLLPVGEGTITRGFLFMLMEMTIGFLHGAISKTEIDHLKEILIIIGVDIFFGFLMVIVFYLQKDPHFAYDVEFGRYLSVFYDFFNIDQTTYYAQNVGVIIKNGVISYMIALSFISVLLTHILMHLTLKYICRNETTPKPFFELEFSISKVAAIFYLVGIALITVLSFVLKYELTQFWISVINVIFTVFFSVTIIFVFQGILVVNLGFEAKGYTKTSFLTFVLGIILFPIAAILGAINPLLPRKEKEALSV